jgi:threonine dehydratase
MLPATMTIDRPAIERTHALIAPRVRLTPVVDASGADLGLAPFPLTLKLEVFQHSGCFKTRGAFTNLLTRTIPGSATAWLITPA